MPWGKFQINQFDVLRVQNRVFEDQLQRFMIRMARVRNVDRRTFTFLPNLLIVDPVEQNTCCPDPACKTDKVRHLCVVFLPDDKLHLEEVYRFQPAQMAEK